MQMRKVFALILVPIACSSDPPPCHLDGDPVGTVYGPTPTPLPGPGGPGSPPDHGDAPEKYSKNEEGQVCRCSPYQMGCTTDPDGVADGDTDSVPSSPGGDTGSVSSNPGGNSSETELGEVQCGKAIQGVQCMFLCAENGVTCIAGRVNPNKPDAGMGWLFTCCGCPGKAHCSYIYPNGDTCTWYVDGRFKDDPLCAYQGGK